MPLLGLTEYGIMPGSLSTVTSLHMPVSPLGICKNILGQSNVLFGTLLRLSAATIESREYYI